MSDFYRDIYEIVKLIPKGRVTSYGAIAQALGMSGHSRRVGYALNNCTDGSIPAHRVVNRSGVLTGKNAFGGNTMQTLLEAEGIEVKNDKVLKFKALFWNPANEI